MKTILIFLGIGALYFIFKFFVFRHRQQRQSYISLPENARFMIDNDQAESLANLLLQLEITGNYHHANDILNAIDLKGMGFARKVDKIRNELRKKAGLGSLKF